MEYRETRVNIKRICIRYGLNSQVLSINEYQDIQTHNSINMASN